ncbi:MAG: TIGR02281 family clan AA aspartic protease [Rhizobiaceae bacterium]|nr:TIGR02281 family clan AA aspartic protease [Rhizobiaceae bacterium]
MKMLSFLVSACVVSAGAAAYLHQTVGQVKSSSEIEQVSVAASQPVLRSTSGRIARIRMDSRGHFIANARINGRKIKVLVDTGATSVAINGSTAKRLGIRLTATDFKHKVNTANGVVPAAIATIDRIQIGNVSVRNVKAAVIEGKGLDGTLLGMSFLGQLSEFSISNGELVMRQ